MIDEKTGIMFESSIGEAELKDKGNNDLELLTLTVNGIGEHVNILVAVSAFGATKQETRKTLELAIEALRRDLIMYES